MAKQCDNSDDIAGLCVASEKTVYFDEDNVDFNVVLHELFHAYFSYLYLDDTNDLKLNDIEEICAKFFENKAELIIKKSKEIHKSLKKLQKET